MVIPETRVSGFESTAMEKWVFKASLIKAFLHFLEKIPDIFDDFSKWSPSRK